MAEKILVVDDDLDTLKLVGMMLERQGYGILAASSGQQALSVARSEKPDLIVLDLMMPDIDGLQVARQLRSDPETQNIRILMFTARTQMDDKLEGYDAGADDYLVKPIQPRELVAHVRAVLKRGGNASSALANRERGALIGFISPKGGVGVSTLTINTGVALSTDARKPVIVADFRPGCGTIGPELGLANPQGINRLLALDAETITPAAIEAELIEQPGGVRLLLSSADPWDARNARLEDHFAAIARNLPYLATYALLDLGPALTLVNLKAIDECQQLILVIEPVGNTIAQARRLYDRLVENGYAESRIMPVLVNRQRAGMQLSLGQAQDQFGHPIHQVFTAAPELAYQAQVSNTPMALRQPDGVTTQQFVSLARKVLQPVQ